MQPGRRMKKAELHKVDGTYRPARHEEVAEAGEGDFGPLVMPPEVEVDPLARRTWEKMIVPATWLDASKTMQASQLCLLWAKFLKQGVDKFPLAGHTQIRNLCGELGLSDERNRITVKNGRKQDPASKYLAA